MTASSVKEGLLSLNLRRIDTPSSLEVATRGPRTGRNPRDGQKIKIAAKKVAKFKPGKKLADDVNGKGGKKKK